MVNHYPERTLETYAQEYADDPEFVAEGLAIKVTEEMLECLEQRNLSQSWLAEQMGVSRAHISRILNARPNMTLLTISKIAVALGVQPDVCLDTEPWRLSRAKTASTVLSEASVSGQNRMYGMHAAGEIGFDFPLCQPVTTASGLAMSGTASP